MHLNNLSVSANGVHILNNLNWIVKNRESWVVLGTNASGKSTLAKVLTGDMSITSGTIENQAERIEWVSLESQQTFYERELYRDDTDFLDQIDHGTPVRTLLEEISPWIALHDTLVNSLRLDNLLERGYRLLSTGEGRRVMLARALLSKPNLLILDEPFEGLDKQSRLDLHAVLNQLVNDGQQLILLINQQEDVVSNFTHLAILDRGQFLFTGAMPKQLTEKWQHLLSIRRQDIQLPARQSDYQLNNWPDDQPLVELTEGFVQYDETYQFQHLQWQLMKGEHTQISGPNGCGKSTLLGLVTGDHPQCYRNDLSVLGFKRGQGESIWEIKKYFGYVSGSLHRDYRVPGNVLTAVVSGLTDSIGVYTHVGGKEKHSLKRG